MKLAVPQMPAVRLTCQMAGHGAVTIAEVRSATAKCTTVGELNAEIVCSLAGCRISFTSAITADELQTGERRRGGAERCRQKSDQAASDVRAASSMRTRYVNRCDTRVFTSAKPQITSSNPYILKSSNSYISILTFLLSPQFCIPQLA